MKRSVFLKANLSEHIDASFYICKNFFISEIPYYHDLKKSELYIGFGFGIKISKNG